RHARTPFEEAIQKFYHSRCVLAAQAARLAATRSGARAALPLRKEPNDRLAPQPLETSQRKRSLRAGRIFSPARRLAGRILSGRRRQRQAAWPPLASARLGPSSPLRSRP